MDVMTTEGVNTAAWNPETHDLTETKQRSLPPWQHNRLPSLAEQREAFIRDRFSTTLEDPVTGKRIRS